MTGTSAGGPRLVATTGAPLDDEPRPRHVRLLCGVAGSGRTTYAQQLAARGWVRLSVDEIVWRDHGPVPDPPPAAYADWQRDADAELRARLADAVRERRAAVVDLSLWNRATRDELRGIVAAHGGTWDLLVFDVEEATVRARLAERGASRHDANSPFRVTDERLDAYLAGFEWPDGEGETHVTWAAPGNTTETGGVDAGESEPAKESPWPPAS